MLVFPYCTTPRHKLKKTNLLVLGGCGIGPAIFGVLFGQLSLYGIVIGIMVGAMYEAFGFQLMETTVYHHSVDHYVLRYGA